MGLTITEKILAAHAGRTGVEPGEFVVVRADIVMGNDGSTAGALPVWRRIGATRVFDPERGAVVFDHFVPNKAQAMKEGLLAVFAEAGAAISPPTWGPCFGGHTGVLGADEVCLSTTNRNFVGRMGHPTARVYLANPVVVAASAVRGAIATPEEVVGGGVAP